MITPEQLAEWRRLADEADPEDKWVIRENRVGFDRVNSGWTDALSGDWDGALELRNLRFASAARTAVPALLDEVERLRGELEAKSQQEQEQRVKKYCAERDLELTRANTRALLECPSSEHGTHRCMHCDSEVKP